MAIDDERLRYPGEVVFTIKQDKKKDYIKAAEFINMSGADIVCLQHEYGIYGGPCGAFIEDTLRNLKKPVVMTMHTVLGNPSHEIMRRTKSLASCCEAIIVLGKKAKDFLVQVYGISSKKIHVILHGVPDVPFIDPNFYKDKFSVEGKTVLLTFGFLSENKGAETVIRALPSVIKQYPDIAYIIQGITHPNILKERGEEYRFRLMHLIKQLGLERNVFFINSFLKLKELTELIGASDIYITPYKNREQISSGTLAYAVGAGKAVVSTPYFCARELLSDGRGMLFPFGNHNALSSLLLGLLKDRKKLHRMRKKAYSFSRNMVWSEIGRKYVKIFANIKKHHIPKFTENKVREVYEDLPDLSFRHLMRMTDDVSLMQHSVYSVPDRRHGYSADDAARALPVVLNQHMQTKDRRLIDLARTYLSFLHYAQTPGGLFHNFMSYERKWLDEVGSEDTQGRIIWGLGYTFYAGVSTAISYLAKSMFDRVVCAANLNSPQAKAYAMCGFFYYMKKFSGATNVRHVMEKYADDLVQMYRQNRKPRWNWFEQTVTYGRAKMSNALLLAYQILKKEEYLKIAIESLDFLTEHCIKDGMLSVIGNQGWLKEGKKKPNFDQQPIDAWYFVDAYQKAFELTGDRKYLDNMFISFEWFLGNNIIGLSLGNTATGSCMDGINQNGANPNKGAESTIAFLSAMQAIANFELGFDSSDKI